VSRRTALGHQCGGTSNRIESCGFQTSGEVPKHNPGKPQVTRTVCRRNLQSAHGPNQKWRDPEHEVANRKAIRRHQRSQDEHQPRRCVLVGIESNRFGSTAHAVSAGHFGRWRPWRDRQPLIRVAVFRPLAILPRDDCRIAAASAGVPGAATGDAIAAARATRVEFYQPTLVIKNRRRVSASSATAQRRAWSRARACGHSSNGAVSRSSLHAALQWRARQPGGGPHSPRRHGSAYQIMAPYAATMSPITRNSAAYHVSMARLRGLLGVCSGSPANQGDLRTQVLTRWVPRPRSRQSRLVAR